MRPDVSRGQNRSAAQAAAAGRVTVRDIAARLNLSIATVSSALTGRRPAGFVTERTRRQVWEAAREMGYPLERLRTRRPLLERVAVFTRANPYSVFQNLTLELCRLLGQREHHILLHAVSDDRQACEIARDLYHRQEVDAALFVGSRDEPEAAEVGDLPRVFIGEVPEAAGQWQVSVDSEDGGRAAGEPLWDLGHRRVGFLGSRTNPLASEKRLRGLMSVWEQRGATFDADWVAYVDYPSEEAVARNLPDFPARFSGGEAPLTALFCYNDYLAGSVLKILRREGVTVPGAVSVVGFDDAVYASLLDPPLTTVVHPFAHLAVEAADLLLLRLRSPDLPPQVRRLPGSLIVRGSTAATAVSES